MKDRIMKLCKEAIEKEGNLLECERCNGKCSKCPFDDETCGINKKSKENVKIAEKYIKDHEEDNKMKKSFREVIADIKKGEVWEYQSNIDLFTIRKEESEIEIFWSGSDCTGINFGENEKFTLQRKKYTFTEAFKAYEEGKEIESCVDRCYRHKLRHGEAYYKTNNIAWTNIGNDENIFSVNEIRGEWYINEENN